MSSRAGLVRREDELLPSGGRDTGPTTQVVALETPHQRSFMENMQNILNMCNMLRSFSVFNSSFKPNWTVALRFRAFLCRAWF